MKVIIGSIYKIDIRDKGILNAALDEANNLVSPRVVRKYRKWANLNGKLIKVVGAPQEFIPNEYFVPVYCVNDSPNHSFHINVKNLTTQQLQGQSCNCPIWLHGCTCGAMTKERQHKAKNRRSTRRPHHYL